MCGIYKITNKINGKIYIGQSIDIQRRWVHHRNSINEPDLYSLQQAFVKYGIENFEFEILEECLPAELNQKEIYYIHYYDSYKNGYNETTGGAGSPNLIVKLTEVDIEEIYELLLYHTEITQNQIAELFHVGKDTISEINHGKTRAKEGYNFPLRNNRTPDAFCVDCGKRILYGSIRCSECAAKVQRKVERPTRAELKTLIRSQSFTAIGKSYGVSDNSIRKWCLAERLPTSKREITHYTDEEWEKI